MICAVGTPLAPYYAFGADEAPRSRNFLFTYRRFNKLEGILHAKVVDRREQCSTFCAGDSAAIQCKLRYRICKTKDSLSDQGPNEDIVVAWMS